MIAEQLQGARAAHWRQNQSPLLTLDDAQKWFQQHPLCLYLPRRTQLPAPAPSFVEACIGNHQDTPGADALEQAQSLLTRLVATGTVVPLNLLGTVSEQPDFLAHTDALPFVLSLRADSDWKHAPQKSSGHKVSPLVLELWKALEKDGALTASEAREALGRELTEAAVLRGLCELWQTLRISPVFAREGEPARWEMLRVRHRDALTTAGNTSQVTALSLLVSMYLQSVYAASNDEIEIFLSPVASRSRVREAVRGLAATRQIHSLSMEARTYYFLEGGLPEFAEVPAASPAEGLPGTPGEPRRPLPVPRKVQATRPVAPEAPSVPASAPIFRRPKPAAPPAVRPGPPTPRPAAGTGGRPPQRQTVGQPAWKPAPKPYRRAEATGKTGGAPPPSFRPKRPFSPAGERPAQAQRRASSGAPPRGADAPPRESRRPYARPDTARPRPARPDTPGKSAASPRSARPSAGGPPRTGARPNSRPSAWAGPAKRDTPKPWALPGRKSSGPPRPPRPGGRSDAPFRPRAPRDVRGPGVPGGVRPDRGPGRGGPPRADRPSRPAAPRSGAPARPFPPRSGPPGAGRFASPRSPGARPYTDRPRPEGRPPFPSRPRTGGSTGRDPSSHGGAPRSTFPAGRPPRKTGPSRPGPRSFDSSRKPGKPPANFRDRKPDRKKPGV